MRGLVLGNGKAWVEDAPDPTPDDDWVIVKVHSSPICGSDKGVFCSEKPSRLGGHEGSGEVVAIDKATRLKVGDRVVLMPLAGCGRCEMCWRGDYIYCRNKPPVQGHFAQYVKAREMALPLLPDDVSYDIGSLACCALGPAFDALKRLEVSGFDTLLITGLGPVGLGALTIAKFRGARVIATDVQPWRRERAREMGADEVLDAGADDLLEQIRDITDGRGPEKAIDCSGNPEAERLCLDSVCERGRIAFIGENQGELSVLPSRQFIRRGLTLLGAWHFNMNDYPDMLKILRRSPVVPKLISHTFSFDQAQQAFETFFSGKAAKVILKPWE